MLGKGGWGSSDFSWAACGLRYSWRSRSDNVWAPHAANPNLEATPWFTAWEKQHEDDVLLAAHEHLNPLIQAQVAESSEQLDAFEAKKLMKATIALSQDTLGPDGE
jgi:hypothetical protein